VTLAVSATWKVRMPAQFRGVLRAHAIVPPGRVRAVGRLLPLAELVAAVGCAAVLGPNRAPVLVVVRLGAALTILLAVAFLGYLGVLAHRQGFSGVACGCTGAHDRFGPVSFVRAAALGLAGCSAFASNPLDGTGYLRSGLLAIGVGAVALGWATWSSIRLPRFERGDPVNRSMSRPPTG
ncbi:MAG TPA: MauE/DoxX family redox-associated membrane protein, partial [Jatrophihabitans sp.]|jgi:hypothetical protein